MELYASKNQVSEPRWQIVGFVLKILIGREIY
jgi:hypothetical protein